MSKNPISILQEWAMREKKPFPQYVTECVGTPQNPEFKCTVTFMGYSTTVVALNKKNAKSYAAVNILNYLGQNNIAPNILLHINQSLISLDSKCMFNYISQLNELAGKWGVEQPQYKDGQHVQDSFAINCYFLKLRTEGLGKTKRGAKHKAAELMWDKLWSECQSTLPRFEQFNFSAL